MRHRDLARADRGGPARRWSWRSSLVGVLLGASLGCSAEPISPSLSPTREEDPARHARAIREMGEVARKNREAEAAFFRGRRAAPAAVPEASNPSESTADSIRTSRVKS